MAVDVEYEMGRGGGAGRGGVRRAKRKEGEEAKKEGFKDVMIQSL